MGEVVYFPSKTMDRFHSSDDFVRGLLGPIGSGKSVACCTEIMKRSVEQKVIYDSDNPNGIRKSRWAIIRNTYRELIDTTMVTWFDWFPREIGSWRAMDMKWTLEKKLDDGTSLHLEVLFRALDRPDDIKKLLSLELTGGWINEGREIPKAVLDMLQGRVGRYPAFKEFSDIPEDVLDEVYALMDGDCLFSELPEHLLEHLPWIGIILDTNPPDNDHWWYKLFEEDQPKGFSLYHQPSAKSPEAENLRNLVPGYYNNIMQGKDQEWINVYVHGKYGFIADGKPVWPEYKDDIHHTLDELPLTGSGKVYVGIDFGLTPAAAIGQIVSSGQFQIIDELVTEDMGAVNFGKLLHEKLSSEYCGCDLEIYADPAGEDRAQTDETTPFEILWNQGIEAWPTYTNDFTIRREAVADYMQRLDFRGKPAFILGPKAKMARKACSGGYKYKRLQVSGQQRFQDKPDKGRYSHIGDAIQYMFLGAVGGERVVGGYSKKEIDQSELRRGIV
jgi:hypothetical protein